eukprot:Ihof_evm11s53 gene=Ihof_evmTU11s53
MEPPDGASKPRHIHTRKLSSRRAAAQYFLTNISLTGPSIVESPSAYTSSNFQDKSRDRHHGSLPFSKRRSSSISSEIQSSSTAHHHGQYKEEVNKGTRVLVETLLEFQPHHKDASMKAGKLIGEGDNAIENSAKGDNAMSSPMLTPPQSADHDTNNNHSSTSQDGILSTNKLQVAIRTGDSVVQNHKHHKAVNKEDINVNTTKDGDNSENYRQPKGYHAVKREKKVSKSTLAIDFLKNISLEERDGDQELQRDYFIRTQAKVAWSNEPLYISSPDMRLVPYQGSVSIESGRVPRHEIAGRIHQSPLLEDDSGGNRQLVPYHGNKLKSISWTREFAGQQSDFDSNDTLGSTSTSHSRPIGKSVRHHENPKDNHKSLDRDSVKASGRRRSGSLGSLEGRSGLGISERDGDSLDSKGGAISMPQDNSRKIYGGVNIIQSRRFKGVTGPIILSTANRGAPIAAFTVFKYKRVRYGFDSIPAHASGSRSSMVAIIKQRGSWDENAARPMKKQKKPAQSYYYLLDAAWGERTYMHDGVVIDDPMLRSGKHRTVLTLPSLMVSVIQYAKPSDLKRDLNEQFREQYPDVLITLSKLRSQKLQMLELGVDVCNIELATLALAHICYERLVLK